MYMISSTPFSDFERLRWLIETYIFFQSKNKISLRNLSMVLRQIGGNPSERAKLVEESVDKAKEAVQMDIQDGTSWCT